MRSGLIFQPADWAVIAYALLTGFYTRSNLNKPSLDYQIASLLLPQLTFVIMGTRGLVGFIILGRKRGFYNHFDSYPEGLGEDIVRFFMALFEAPKARFKENLEKVHNFLSSTLRP